MKKKLLLATFAAACSLNLGAETPDFNYVKVGYTATEPDFFGTDIGGYEVAGAWEINENWYVAGKYFDASDDDLESTRGTLGIGYQLGVSDNTLMFFQVDYAAVNFSQLNAGEFDDSGIQLGVGFRSNITESFELNGSINYLDAGEVDVNFGDYNPAFVLIGGEYNFTDMFAIYADYEFESDEDRYAVGVKFEF